MRQRTPLHVGSTSHEDAESNDILVIIRQDGDTTIDEKVRNEYGLLNSESSDAAIIGAEPATVYTWTTLDAGAIPMGGAYVIDQEQPPPAQIGRFVRGSLREQYIATTALKSTKQKKAARRANWAYAATATACIVVILIGFLILPLWNSYQVRQAVERGAGPAEAAPTPLPTRTPLPTVPPAPTPTVEGGEDEEDSGPIPRSRQ